MIDRTGNLVPALPEVSGNNDQEAGLASSQGRIVDGLLGEMPQAVAANFGLAKEIGGSVFLACREDRQGEQSRVADLTETEYKVLLLISHGLSARAIVTDLSLEYWDEDVVGKCIDRIHTKLEVDSNAQMSTFIPVEEQKLRAVKSIDDLDRCKWGLIDPATYPPPAPTLSPRQAQVFNLTREGYNDQEIALKLAISEITVRRHRQGIVNRPRPDISDTIGPQRLQGGMKSLGQYARVVEEVATTVQPAIADLLLTAKTFKKIRNMGIDVGSKVVCRSENQPRLLTKLEKGGYLPEGTAEHGYLELSGLATALLISHPEYQVRDMMLDELTQPIARETIQQEVGHFLRERQTGTGPVSTAS